MVALNTLAVTFDSLVVCDVGADADFSDLRSGQPLTWLGGPSDVLQVATSAGCEAGDAWRWGRGTPENKVHPDTVPTQTGLVVGP